MAAERTLTWSVLALSLLASSVARADGPVERARVSFEEARSAFARRDFAAAAAAFEMAAELVPHPATWLNAAEAWEERGDAVRAAEDCDHALATPGIDPDLRREAQARLDRNAKRIATLELLGARTLAVRVDDETEAQTLPRRRYLTPGVHTLVVADLAAGRDRRERIAVAAGTSRVIDLEPFDPAPAARPRSSGPPLPALIAFGGAVVLGLGSAALGIATLGARDDFDASPTDETAADFERHRTATNLVLGAAVVAGVVGAVLWLVLPGPRATTKATSSPTLSF